MDRPGGEPTEAPTPRRLEEARRRGQVARSRDLGTAAAFAAVFAVLASGGEEWLASLQAMFASSLKLAPEGGGAATAAAAVRGGVLAAAHALAVPLGAALLAAVGAGLLQTRGLLSPGALRPDLGRLSPAAGLRKMAGREVWAEVGKGLLRVGVIAAVAWVTLRGLPRDLAALAAASPQRTAAGFGAVAAHLGTRLVLATLLLGIADYLWQRAAHARSLRMTREEVKREHRESDGDPRHKAERQRLHREIGEQRMVADVRKADFVVVNPDHIAVALRYDGETDAAPVVVARGERLLAERIKDVAREAGVPIFRDVSLARSLRDVEEGDEIPEALYQAVAEILRVVRRVETEAPAAAAIQEAAPAPSRSGDAVWTKV